MDGRIMDLLEKELSGEKDVTDASSSMVIVNSTALPYFRVALSLSSLLRSADPFIAATNPTISNNIILWVATIQVPRFAFLARCLHPSSAVAQRTERTKNDE
jgi:hypothetical protein